MLQPFSKELPNSHQKCSSLQPHSSEEVIVEIDMRGWLIAELNVECRRDAYDTQLTRYPYNLFLFHIWNWNIFLFIECHSWFIYLMIICFRKINIIETCTHTIDKLLCWHHTECCVVLNICAASKVWSLGSAEILLLLCTCTHAYDMIFYISFAVAILVFFYLQKGFSSEKKWFIVTFLILWFSVFFLKTD